MRSDTPTTNVQISIHVPRVEDDIRALILSMLYTKFQSTSPVWRTTVSRATLCSLQSFQSTSPVWRTTGEWGVDGAVYFISIHVPRVEDDFSASSVLPRE